MGKTIIEEVQDILKSPPEKRNIPIQRAANALGTALTQGKNEYHLVRFLEMGTRTNLYFTYPSQAARDENGNYDSPIFQDSRYNNMPPLWQLFREQLERKLGHKITRVVYGEYHKATDGEEFFKVKDEPAQGSWIYIEKPRNAISITQLKPDEIRDHQAIFSKLLEDRAYKIAKEHAECESSKKCKNDSIAYLRKRYPDPDSIDRFNFESDHVFRFRQFNTEFSYTPEGLERFDNFYNEVAEPYRQDEDAEVKWQATGEEIRKRILSDTEISEGLIFENAHEFRFMRLENGGCEVSIDLIDDRTGRQFSVRISSQNPDDIFKGVTAKLRVVLQRKEQARRAIGTLQRLASCKT